MCDSDSKSSGYKTCFRHIKNPQESRILSWQVRRCSSEKSPRQIYSQRHHINLEDFLDSFPINLSFYLTRSLFQKFYR